MDYLAFHLVANDLNSMTQRIEHLGAHPLLTGAMQAVQQAERDVRAAQADLRQREMHDRFRTI